MAVQSQTPALASTLSLPADQSPLLVGLTGQQDDPANTNVAAPTQNPPSSAGDGVVPPQIGTPFDDLGALFGSASVSGGQSAATNLLPEVGGGTAAPSGGAGGDGGALAPGASTTPTPTPPPAGTGQGTTGGTGMTPPLPLDPTPPGGTVTPPLPPPGGTVTPPLPPGGTGTPPGSGGTGTASGGIGGRVWSDTNANGVREAGETGRTGVTVYLQDGMGNQLGLALTGDAGAYQFTGLAAGTYYVRFVAPAGAAFSPPDVGSDASDSDATLSGLTSAMLLAQGESRSNVDAGLVSPHSVQAADDAFSLPHDQQLDVAATQGLLANDTSTGGGPLSAALVSGPTHGLLSLGADGAFTYVPFPGYHGTDSFIYAASDGAQSATATVSLSITNEAPQAAGDRISVLGSAATSVPADAGVLANDYDPDGDALTASLVSGPAHGGLTLYPDGSFVYVPGADFSGTDSFIYSAGDGASSSNATVTLIAGPVAADDFYSLQHDATFTVEVGEGVLANDSVATGSTLTASLASGPSHGTLSLAADGSFVYAPAAGYVGGDSFTYVAAADSLLSTPATVTLGVVNQAPEATDVKYSVRAGGLLSPEGGLAAVTFDADADDTLTFTLAGAPSHGTLVDFNADGTFAYQPNAGYVGADSFGYRASDGAASSAATVTIHVEDQAPVAVAASFDVAAGGTLAADPSRNLLQSFAYDPDGDALAASMVSGPAHGTVSLHADGTFDYTPSAGYTGADSFAFAVSDGTLTSDPATVSLNVTGAPVAHDDAFMLPLSEPLVISAADGVLGNDFSPSGEPLTAQLEQGPATGTLSLASDGSLVYTPDPLHPILGDVTFTYRAVAGGVPSEFPALVAFEAKIPKVTLLDEEWIKGASFIKKDDDSGFYGEVQNRTGVTATANSGLVPVAFVAGATADLQVRFKVDAPELIDVKKTPFGTPVPVLFAMLAPLDFAGIFGTAIGDVASTVAGSVIDKGVWVVTYKGLKVTSVPDYKDDVKSSWAFRMKGDDKIRDVSGTTKYTTYFLNAAPAQGVTLYHTVVRVGAQAARDSHAAFLSKVEAALGHEPTPDEMSQAWKDRNAKYDYSYVLQEYVMRRFETLSIKRADDGQLLTYYSDWVKAAPVVTVQDLLQNTDGQCTAWARFFFDVLRAQGLSLGEGGGLISISPKNQNAGMLVKNWTPLVGRADKSFYSPDDFFVFNKATNTWGYRWIGRPAAVPSGGIAGQGNPNPKGIFNDHTIVALVLKDGKKLWFDPSYGKRFTGNTDSSLLLAFQNGSLAYLAATDPITPQKRRMLLTPITSRTEGEFLQMKVVR